MGGGRKSLKKEALEGCLELQEGQTIMQVVSLRGSNIFEVMDGTGTKTLALLPAKFRKSLWMKRGSYILVEESNREKALEAGNKVTCTIQRVLYDDQVRTLKKSHYWPEGFNCETKCLVPTTDTGDFKCISKINRLEVHSEKEEENQGKVECSSDDEDLPPLEANCNRVRPAQLHIASSEEETSDSDS